MASTKKKKDPNAAHRDRCAAKQAKMHEIMCKQCQKRMKQSRSRMLKLRKKTWGF